MLAKTIVLHLFDKQLNKAKQSWRDVWCLLVIIAFLSLAAVNVVVILRFACMGLANAIKG